MGDFFLGFYVVMTSGVLVWYFSAFYGNNQFYVADYIQVCNFNEPDLAGCIWKSVIHLQPKLATGMPDIDVPPLEPLHFDEIQLRNTGNSILRHVDMTGASTFELKEVKANIQKNKFGFKINIPQLKLEGTYDINVQILRNIPIKGKGPIHGNFTNVEIVGILKGRLIKMDNVEFLKFDDMKVEVAIGKAVLNLENLFNGDPALGKATNDVINDNTDFVLGGVLPNLELTMSKRFTDLANKIVRNIPYAELFPKK